MELLSALDNVLSQKAEDTLTEFAAVKKADVQLQTQLGNRQGQIAANIIGAFSDSQSHAFGWQVRVYGGENDSKGANAGIFFRRVDGESLYGINTFADYEKGKYGEFLRYGIGGELKNRFAAFAMNYYLPITDDKHTGSTVAFSQKGYDANLRINIPQLDFLKVRADYYHFDGKYGGENDNGFRYGLELQPIANLRIGAFYDDGGEKFGGDIAYVYNISEPQLSPKQESTGFAPDLFSPVVREYSQRIITATTGPQISLRATLTTYITTTFSPITTTMTTGNLMTVANVMRIATLTMTTRMITETEMIMELARAASVHFTTRIDNPAGQAGYVIATIQQKHLITLPPALQITRPLFLTINRNWRFSRVAFRVVEDGSIFPIGTEGRFLLNAFNNLTITIVEGSEDYTSPAGMMTTTMTMTTTMRMTLSAEMTTFMTNRVMPMILITIMTMTPITMAMTLFERITIGAMTMTTGAAKVDSRFDSHLPPSFPPSSFPQMPKIAAVDFRIPPSFPQLPKLALAAPVILARRARIQHNRAAIIQKPQRQYAQ